MNFLSNFHQRRVNIKKIYDLSIMHLYTPILPMVAYCEVIITSHHYHNW